MNSQGAVWVAGEVLIDLIPDSSGARQPVVGGGGANTAKALARLDIPTYFIDGISTDEFGVIARRELESSGVDLSLAMTSDKSTALAKVSLDDRGSASYEFSLQGTSTFDFTSDWLPSGSPKVLHYGTLATLIEPGATQLFHWAKTLTAAKVFDPNIRPSVLGDRMKYRQSVDKWISISDVVKLSDDDLFWLYPEAKDLDGAIEIAGEMLNTGSCSIVVITRGSKGLIGVTEEGVVEVPGVIVDVIDTVGAGDTVGAILVEAIYRHGLGALVGDGLEKTLKRAARAAAITCSRSGAQPPTRAELLD